MKNVSAIMGIAIALVSLGCSAAMAQSVYGPGGLFLNPTAYTPGQGRLIASVLGRKQDMGALPGHWAAHQHNLTITGVDYGLNDRTEAGFTYINIRGDMRTPPTYGPFFKYVVTKETDLKPQVAVGAVWLPNSHWRTQFGFAVASKRLSAPVSRQSITGHIGLMNASFLNHERTSDWATYAGIDVGLSNSIHLIVEARTKTSADHGLPSAFGIVLTSRTGMTLAFSLANDGAGHKNLFSIGAGYRIATVD